MKKLFITLLLVAGVVAYFYTSKNHTSAAETLAEKDPDITTSSSEQHANTIKKLRTTEEPLNKLEELEIAHAECKNRKLDFGNEVNKIHQVLLDALEYELRNGKTFRELLAYAGQYRTYFQSYASLLTQAKINIEKEKYDFTRSLDILNEWRGIQVIDNLSEPVLSELVQALKPFESNSHGLNIQLKLSEQVKKADILALLDNDTNFNTYLEENLMKSKPARPRLLAPTWVHLRPLNGPRL